MRQLTSKTKDINTAGKVANAILNLVGKIPDSNKRRSYNTDERARIIINKAAAGAALSAGGLALPPGLIGWATILPELITVWKIQAQMVADLAAIYGKKKSLTREQMIYCLFRHTAAQAVRDLVVRAGERYLVQRVSLRTFQAVAKRVGVRLTQRVIGKGISRWLLIVGAVGVGAYAYYDTAKVGETAIELFTHDIEVVPESDSKK